MHPKLMLPAFTVFFGLVAAPPATPQSGICRLYFTMLNSTRHVVGKVNAECNDVWHSTPFGNWGVESNFGSRTDTTQFTGWKWSDNKYQWNSCTSERVRDDGVSCNYYNHDHNGNGRCEDQGSNAEYGYAWFSVHYGVNCPYDSDRDGTCDWGGCLYISNFTVSNQYLVLYEMDAPDGDDLIGSLSVHRNCCTVTGISCAAHGCGGYRYSPSYATVAYSPPALNTTANVRMRFDWATFIDNTGYCAYLGQWDPGYNCW